MQQAAAKLTKTRLRGTLHRINLICANLRLRKMCRVPFQNVVAVRSAQLIPIAEWTVYFHNFRVLMVQEKMFPLFPSIGSPLIQSTTRFRQKIKVFSKIWFLWKSLQRTRERSNFCTKIFSVEYLCQKHCFCMKILQGLLGHICRRKEKKQYLLFLRLDANVSYPKMLSAVAGTAI